ncbi:WRKY1 transcription factor [Heracleum sosnowskyi]|uniref:WRKY1 transcription factor n=1 Tax=Heracleum sosnowskyi TaxID=360622 RepID=A0AAD8IA70_9APIA|nr:WRKY1 transcription factor [Heracleum sosnowskyi]
MGTICEFEKSTIANELIQGMEVARQLKFHLSSSSTSPENELCMLQKILSSYDTALLLLNWSESSVVQPQAVPAMVNLPESPISTNESGDFKDHHRDVSNKRKALPTWKDQVKICSDNGVGNSADDGYSWRKYGQKDILGAKHPRSYYRCTYKKTRTCHATKQVQKSDNDPAIFEITYKGKHTCLKASNSVPPATPEKQEQKHSNHQQQEPNDVLINFRANLRVKTDDFRVIEASDSFSFPSRVEYNSQLSSFSQLVNEDLIGTFSPSFVSPETTGSSYFSVSPYQMNSFPQLSDSDYTEIISANTSTTNSPILDMDFQIDEVNLGLNFQFDTPGYF